MISSVSRNFCGPLNWWGKFFTRPGDASRIPAPGITSLLPAGWREARRLEGLEPAQAEAKARTP